VVLAEVCALCVLSGSLLLFTVLFSDTAFCKNVATGRWYSFNDSRATEMREEEVVTRAAYLLFYQRRSAANDSSRSHDWLSQLQLSTNSSLPRTVTSHSLENIVDGEKGWCSFWAITMEIPENQKVRRSGKRS